VLILAGAALLFWLGGLTLRRSSFSDRLRTLGTLAAVTTVLVAVAVWFL
jgi:hypothetical protein